MGGIRFFTPPGDVLSHSFALSTDLNINGNAITLVLGAAGSIWVPLTFSVYVSSDFATDAPYGFGDQIIICSQTLNFGMYMPLTDIENHQGNAGSVTSSLTNSGSFLSQYKPNENLVAKIVNGSGSNCTAGALYCTVVYQKFTAFTV